MKLFIALAGIIFLMICESSANKTNSYTKRKNTNSYLNVMQIIRKFGYPAEAHTVKTSDGYLLQMHRIPHRKYSDINITNSLNGEKPPIFMQHGLLGSSMDFFIIGSQDALPRLERISAEENTIFFLTNYIKKLKILSNTERVVYELGDLKVAFLLADLGFDVWLGNVRGNTYSRAHVNLFKNDKKFWNFTWHESAIYDIPAQIDFICNHTKQEKIIYIGFSMGTTMFFAMTSTLPEYRNKIHVSFLMAAVAYVKNIKSPVIRFLAPFIEQFNKIAQLIDNGAFMANELLFKMFGKIFCEMTNIDISLCMNAIFLIVGSDPEEFDKTLLPSLINNYPAGYSTKAVIHYSQLVKSGKFRQYDYGEKGNILQYDSPTPPDYNLSLVTTPMFIYEGKNDYLSTLIDIKHLTRQLSNLRKLRVIDYPRFSHLDFLVSYDVKKWVYDELIEDLISSLNYENSIIIQ